METDFNTELAREQTILANERTFLSWIRTGLAIVGGGIVVVRFVIIENPLEHLLVLIAGKILIAWGIGIFVFSLYDFRRVYKKKNTPMPFSANCFISFLVGTLIAVSAILLFVI